MSSMGDWEERLAFWQLRQSYVLGCKQVQGADALREAIDHDRVVALAAARTLMEQPSIRLALDDFFADHASLRDRVLEVVDGTVLDHIGFQILEPMDVWFEGLALWAPRLGFEVVGTKRFTASEAFRARVGCFVEMAQVWLRAGGTTVELELFDLHRPNSDVAGVRSGAASRETRARLEAATPNALRALVADDDIWHFGVRIEDEPAVDRIHEEFLALVEADDRFRLRTVETVANPWHGSVHTKLTNLEVDTEIEFLTYDVDWETRACR